MEECVDKFSWAPDVAEFKQLCMSYKGSSKIPWAEEVLKFEKPRYSSREDVKIKILIDEGAQICKSLKRIKPDLNWWQIAGVFTELKKKARKFYPGMDDVKLILELLKYTDHDLADLLEMEVG